MAVEGDLEAWDWVVAVWLCLERGAVDVDDDGACKNWSLCELACDDVAADDGEGFILDFLRGVVGVECPAVLSGVVLAGVLAHDLGAGDGLALGHAVFVADVEYEGCWLTHWLDTDEVVADESWEAFADEWQREAGEVGDVGGGCHVFKQHA